MICRPCDKAVAGNKCDCGNAKLKYAGLIVHDFRRSAARELRKAGVPESTIMDIGGWKTRQMFKRYAITDTRDIQAAIELRERARAENNSDVKDASPSGPPSETKPANVRVN